MPIFECSKCGCIENTACSRYWIREKTEPPLCSECDPKIGKWHNRWPKESAKGYFLGNDGYLYHKNDVNSDKLDWRKQNQGFEIVKEIT